MCGIFAVSNCEDAVSQVFAGLKSLEYRGYDSWGIAVSVRGQAMVEKHLGKISAGPSLPKSKYAFGHTRWATHGGVTEANTHPHLDCSGRFAVVHNGIVENSNELKEGLTALGHQFVSETDTEVISHLIEANYKGDLRAAAALVFEAIRGYSAFVVFDIVTQEFAAIRRGSPLVVGMGQDEILLASDALSLSPYTRRVVYLPDAVTAHVQGGKVRFSNMSGGKLKLPIERMEAGLKPVTRDKFAHFMPKEINEQSRLVASFQTKVRLPERRNIILFGCGSAYFAALYGANLLSVSGRHAQAIQANEAASVLPWIGRRDLAILVSQSGETLDVLETMRELKRRDVPTLALVNVIGSSLSRGADLVLPLRAGPEVAVATTKVFTAMLSALHLLSGGQTGELKQAGKALDKFDGRYASGTLLPLVERLKDGHHVYILGKGQLYPIALETALKLKEVAYIHAEGFASGELKHGMIALIEPGTSVIILVPEDGTKNDLLSAAQEVKARGAYVIGVGPEKNPIFDYHVPVAGCGKLTAIPMVVAMQLLAYHLAVAKNLDPDKPRNLAKSVTVK